jgi:DNA repair exonuclease SbcCD ATPase subunit
MFVRLSLVVPLLLASATTYAVVNTPNKEAIFRELDKVMQDQAAFPMGSIQTFRMNEFKQAINRLYDGSGSMPNAQYPNASVPPYTNPPYSNAPYSQQQSQSQSSNMRRYADQMKQHRNLTNELEQVKAFHQRVDAQFRELQNLSTRVRQYNDNIKRGGEIGPDYDQLVGQYDQNKRSYDTLKQQYLAAYNTYNQHLQAYKNTFGSSNQMAAGMPVR